MIQITDLMELENHLDGIKAVVFDVDDTLITESEYAKAAFETVAAKIPEVDHFVDRLMAVHKQRGRALQKVLSEENMADRVEEAFAIYSAFEPQKVEMYPGAEELLRRLRAEGYALGVITDGRVDGQWKKVRAMGLEELVDAIIVTDELGGPEFRKPCPEAFIRMQAMLQVPFEQMLYVGDNIARDVEPCEKLGIRAVHFNNPQGFFYLSEEEARKENAVLAVDIGASSMRGVVGRYNGKNLIIKEIGRYPTPYADLGPVSYWDLPAMFENVTALLRAAQAEEDIKSIGIDCFGGCTAFIDSAGRLLENPGYTRARPETMAAMLEQAATVLSQEEANAAAGFDARTEYRQIQKMKYITAFRPGFAAEIDKILFLSSALGYYLCGKPYVEMSQLTAQQWSLFTENKWNVPLAKAMGLREEQLTPVVWAGTRMGPLTDEIQKAQSLAPCEVIAVAEHDTGSAMSLLADEKNAAYLSLGTVVVLSMPVEEPALTVSAAESRFLNEGSYDHITRLTRNINGLFFIQSCRAAWEKKGLCTDYAFLEAEAEKCPGNRYVFDPAMPKFRSVPDVPAALEKHFGATLTQGEVVRAIYDSLGRSIADNLKKLEAETGKSCDILCAVGGGIRSSLLCRCIANATGKAVKAVSPEGTALGNICVQLIALGAMSNMNEAITAINAQAFYTPGEI